MFMYSPRCSAVRDLSPQKSLFKLNFADIFTILLKNACMSRKNVLPSHRIIGFEFYETNRFILPRTVFLPDGGHTGAGNRDVTDLWGH